MNEQKSFSHRNFLHTAIRAAQAAARIHQHYVGRDLGIDTKSNEIDLVTRVDKESEARIREILLSAYPDHVVLGEEEGQDGDAPYRWIVDPLDGTLNYAHGFPFYCVSIGLEIQGQIEVGVVLDSVRHELFTATRGGGAFLNGAPVSVTAESDLRKSMLATGFAYNPGTAADNVAVFGRMMARCRALRRPGAAALDLAYVACGRLDGFWELKLNPWDVAAGVLLVTEAGGRVTGGGGQPYRLGDGVLAASNGPLHETLLAALELPAALLV
jgi:myo-inositol-1(or 4)-monophosphatase